MKDIKGSGSSRRSDPWFIMFSVFLLVLLFAGWRVRAERHFVPDSGLGYFAGIAGTTLMFVLLLYPVRKKSRLMHGWGATQSWFKIHMILGVAGPALILLHCNFSLGSLNGAVALISTIVVATSGLIGRYVYQKIYLGFTDRQTSLQELQQAVDENRSGLLPVFDYIPGLKERLRKFESLVKMPYDLTLLSAFFYFIYIRALGLGVDIAEGFRIRKALRELAKTRKWSRKKRKVVLKKTRNLLDTHLAAVLHVSTFTFYERVFSLWHLLHLPLFCFLVLIVVVHAVVVQMY